MAGPKPQDEYTPYASVTPSLSAPQDTLSVRASPADFGGQIGSALQGAGQEIKSSGNELLNTAIQVQGLANEHAANAAEMDLAVRSGQLYDQFKSKSGLEAANSKDSYVQKMVELNNEIRSGLGSPQAQRAYDALATRRMAFAIQDMNSYASSQRKKAYLDGNMASIKLSRDQAERYDVASNPEQFDFEKANAQFQINAAYTSPGYGKYQDTPAKEVNGRLVFDQNTEEGKLAQADYDNFSNEQLGLLYQNAVNTLANDPMHGNINNAMAFLEKNKNDMSPETYGKLSKALAPAYRGEQARASADDTLSTWMGKYQDQMSGGDLTDTFIQQESGNGATSTNLGQIQPETWKQYAKPGEDINNASDNRAVTQRILSDLSARYSGDSARIAVAYFSGPGNVSPPGSANPWINDLKDKNGKSVSSYVSDIQNRLGSGPTPINSEGAAYTTKAQFLEANYDKILDDTKKNIADKGYDFTVQDQAVQRVAQRMNIEISAQAKRDKASADFLYKIVSDPKTPYTSIDQLDHNPNPQVRELWNNFQNSNPRAANGFRKYLTSNSRGKATTYGADFGNHLSQIVDGTETDTMNLGNYITDNTKNSPLTNTGIDILKQQREIMETPEGQAFVEQERAFLNNARSVITGESTYPGMISPDVGNAAYNKWLETAVPKILGAYKAGKTAQELFGDEKSPDFLGKTVNPPTEAELNKYASQSLFKTLSSNSAPQVQAAGKSQSVKPQDMNFSSPEQLRAAVNAGKMTESQAYDWMMDNGKIGPTREKGHWFHVAPQVPKPFVGG